MLLHALQDIAGHDFAFENIIAEPEKQLRILAEHLGVADQVWSSFIKLHISKPSSAEQRSVLQCKVLKDPLLFMLIYA